MSTPERKIQFGMKYLFTPQDALGVSKDLTEKPIDVGGRPSYPSWFDKFKESLPVGIRNTLGGPYTSENVKELRSSDAATEREITHAENRIPLDPSLGVNEAYDKRRADAERYVDSGGDLGGIPLEPSLFEKIIPEEIRSHFRPSTTWRESAAGKLDKGIGKTVDVAMGEHGGLDLVDPTQFKTAASLFGRLGKVAKVVDVAADAPRILNRMSDILSEAKTGEGVVGAGFDPSLFKKLGANLYKGNLPSVAIKESLQNSIDSVRGIEGGKVNLDFSPQNRSFTIIDNGIGMDPEVMAKEFMDVGGSLKGAEASGGYGLAKVGIFSQAENINVASVSNVRGKKVLTTLTGSGEDWVNGKLKIEAHEIAGVTPTGTTMEIKLNQEVADQESWMTVDEFLGEFQHTGRLSGIDVGITKNLQPYSRYALHDYPIDPVETINLPEADIDVYPAAGEARGGGYIAPRILNKGLYQFKQFPIHVGEGVPASVIFDIKPKVGVDDAGYPFTTSREEVKGGVQIALENYLKEIGTLSARRQFDLLRENIRVPTPLQASRSGKSVYNIDAANTPELLELVGSTQYAGPLSDLSADISLVIHDAISSIERYKKIPLFDFGGVGLSPKSLGVNIALSKLAETGTKIGQDVSGIGARNMILINPYTILSEGIIELGTVSPKRAAQQTWETLLHEVLHQLSRGHTEEFAGVYTRTMHAVTHLAKPQIEELTEIWDFAIRNGILNDMKVIENVWRKGKADNLFKAFSGHLK